MAAAGAVFKQTGLLTDRLEHKLMKYLVNFFLPCLSFSFVFGNDALRDIFKIIQAPLAGFLTISTGFLIAYFTAPFLGAGERIKRESFMFTIGIYNFSFIAIPLIDHLFGSVIVGFVLVFILGADIAYWGIGVTMVRRAAGTEERCEIDALSAFLKAIYSFPSALFKGKIPMPLIAIITSLILNKTSLVNVIHLPDLWPVYLAASFAIPLGLFVSGSGLMQNAKQMDIKNDFKLIGGSILLRLVVIPVFFVIAASLIPFSLEIKKILSVMAAMPAGIFSIAILKYYGGDTKISAQIILTTTLIAICTIPFVVTITMNIIGVS